MSPRLDEALFSVARRAFDYAHHPRDRGGRFQETLRRLEREERHALVMRPHSRLGTSPCALYPGLDVAVHRALPAALRAITPGTRDVSDRIGAHLESTSPRFGRRARA